MASKATVKTRILMISDTHQGFKNQKTYSDDGAFRPPFPKVDILLHSGDLTMTGRIDEYRGALAMLRKIPAELKLVIAGNHDLTLHKNYYLNEKFESGELYARHLDPEGYDPKNVDAAEQYWTGKEAVETEVTYLTEGLHTFSLANGASFTIYASPWQPECKCSFKPRQADNANCQYKSTIGPSTIRATKIAGIQQIWLTVKMVTNSNQHFQLQQSVTHIQSQKVWKSISS